MDTTVRNIDVLLYDGFNLLDVAGPVQAFSSAQKNGKALYQMRYVSVLGGSVRSCCGLPVSSEQRKSRSRRMADVLIPGGEGVDAAIQDSQFLRCVRQYQQQVSNNRLISVCSGALILAAAGFLKGREATTHWSREQQALDQFSDTRWQINRIYCHDNQVYTSAGVTAGIDLALSMIHRDHGGVTALAVARELVMSMRRSGGQQQYSDLLADQFSHDSIVSKLVIKLNESPAKDWSLDAMAALVDVTPRTLCRRFQASVGTTPAKVLEKTRVRIAGELLSEGMPVAKAAKRSGFGHEQNMQRSFKRVLDVTVGEYVRKFGFDQ